MFKKNLMTNIYIKFNEWYFWTNQFLLAQKDKLSLTYVQIGRASCRERV